jgi:hypothetical protein
MEQGWFKRNNVKVGNVVEFSKPLSWRSVYHEVRQTKGKGCEEADARTSAKGDYVLGGDGEGNQGILR